jgi:hypothetical protein
MRWNRGSSPGAQAHDYAGVDQVQAPAVARCPTTGLDGAAAVHGGRWRNIVAEGNRLIF